MASFRTGFKIIGEISLKQGLGRIRSFSEDKRPSHWLPEDQWAVRQPKSTCPDLCEKKRKPPKPSKSWLSLCKDPDEPRKPDCDVRHNNCPPPPIKDEAPWYSLNRYIPKKKPAEKPPPLQSCCEEMRRRELAGEDLEVGPNICAVEIPSKCIPKPPKKASPAPVANLSCPIPKALNIMLLCDCNFTTTPKAPPECQNDRLPYDEFRPQKIWKPPPFSLPCKFAPTFSFPPCSSSCIPFSEFKYIEVPKPLYTRYKSVELCDRHTLFNMTEVQCTEDGSFTLGVSSNLPPPPSPFPLNPEPPENEKEQICPEKRVLEAGSRKPVKLKNATKFCFTPKPTKLIERRVYKDCFGNKKSDLPFRTPTATDESDSQTTEKCEVEKTCNAKCEKPDVEKTDAQTEESHVHKRASIKCRPPKWMHVLCKPGAKACPLLPCSKEFPFEDSEEFKSDEEDVKEILKPPRIPTCPTEQPVSSPSPLTEIQPGPPDHDKSECRFVLMPEKYNIKLMRQKECLEETETNTVEKIIEKKATPTIKCPNYYQPIKENILYDLQRLCPVPPLDPTKLNVSRKPPNPACPQPQKFYRNLSTLAPSSLRKLCFVESCKIQRRTECNDNSGKCKARDITPKPQPCPEPPPPTECADIALPCCPKARVPPNCNVKRPLPCCKKKLAPKPSFSECSKDPPPCPRPTECNCWFYVGTHSNNLSNLLYADKIKCFTKKPAFDTTDYIRNKLKAGFKDPKVEPEHKSTVPKINQEEANASKKEIPLCMKLVNDENPSFANDQEKKQKFMEPTDAVQNYNNEILRDEQMKEENSLTIYNPPEQTEESSKAFMDSIGSWINDLFNASNKMPDSDIKTEKVKTEKEIPLEHTEYVKLLNAIKKRYQKKLKNETSVHVSTPDKPFEFNFESDLKSARKKTKSQFSSEYPENLEEMPNSQDDFSETLQFLDQQGDSNAFGHGLVFKPNEVLEDFFSLDCAKNSNSSSMKGKKKLKSKGFENKKLRECVAPTTAELSKRIRLNVSDQDKGLHLLKNSHLGVQESQHYGQGKKRAYQVNARCYTTNANPKENLETMKNTQKCSQYCTPQALKLKGAEEILSKNSTDIKKYIAHRSLNGFEMPKDSMTVPKINNTKLSSSSTETPKSDTKTPSDELVRYLMKKIKTNPRPTLKKKTNSNALEPVTHQTQKNKIKRSATNSVVMKIAAKNDNQVSLRNDSRALSENKLIANREIQVKYPENLRFDISRPGMSSKFNKCSCFGEFDKVGNDRYHLEKNSGKNSRRFNEIFSKRNDKKANEIYKKDILSMSPKMDVSFIAFQKPKQKEVKKDLVQNEYLNSEGIEMTDLQMARFKKQHELFKMTFKAPEPASDGKINPPETTKSNLTKTEKQADLPNSNLLPVEIVDSETTLQLLPEEKDNEKVIKSTAVTIPPKELESKTFDLPTDKNPLNLKVEKKTPEKLLFAKNKGYKIKTLILSREEPKMIINPFGEIYNSESKNQKDPSRSFESSSCAAEMKTAKTTETTLFNRRYSTRTLNEISPKSKPALLSGQPDETNFYVSELEGNSSNKVKDKREKTPKLESQEASYDSSQLKTIAKKLEIRCEEE